MTSGAMDPQSSNPHRSHHQSSKVVRNLMQDLEAVERAKPSPIHVTGTKSEISDVTPTRRDSALAPADLDRTTPDVKKTQVNLLTLLFP